MTDTGLVSLPILLEGNRRAHMTPVISDSWFMKGELLIHIHEHDGFISTSAQRKYTEGSVLQTKCPLLSHKENGGQILGLWASVHAHVGVCINGCVCVL